MKESGRITKSITLVSLNGKMEAGIKDFLKKIKELGMAK